MPLSKWQHSKAESHQALSPMVRALKGLPETMILPLNGHALIIPEAKGRVCVFPRITRALWSVPGDGREAIEGCVRSSAHSFITFSPPPFHSDVGAKALDRFTRCPECESQSGGGDRQTIFGDLSCTSGGSFRDPTAISPKPVPGSRRRSLEPTARLNRRLNATRRVPESAAAVVGPMREKPRSHALFHSTGARRKG